MILYGPREYIEQEINECCPRARAAMLKSGHIKAQLLPYQAMALYTLAERYNVDKARILEIGTGLGYSASVIAQAAPKAQIITLNTSKDEVEVARKYLVNYANVFVANIASWDYLKDFNGGPLFDMIFVDGDHKHVRRDMPWFNVLKPGGLMLFHDYSIMTSTDVYNTVNQFMSQLGRQLDVNIVDMDKIGMAGLFKKEGEKWQI